MSGFLKSVGKAFKKIVRSPIFKAVLIGAAVYFTGGLALGAMGGAVLPGVGTLASTLGITAGSFGAAAAGTVGIAASTAASAAGWAVGAGESLGGGLGAAFGMTEAAGAAAGAGASAIGSLAAPASEAVGISGAPVGMSAGATGPASTSWFGSLTKGAQSFFNSTFGQKIAGQAIEMGGKAILGAMQSKQEQDRYEQNREDVIRRGYVPDVTSQYAAPTEPARPGNIGTPVVVGGGPMSGIGGGGAGSYRTGYQRPAIVASALDSDLNRQQTAGA